jgi:hypothetical protein
MVVMHVGKCGFPHIGYQYVGFGVDVGWRLLIVNHAVAAYSKGLLDTGLSTGLLTESRADFAQ